MLNSQVHPNTRIVSEVIADIKKKKKFPVSLLSEFEALLKEHINTNTNEGEIAEKRVDQSPLTSRQKETLDYIKRYIGDNGFAPTLDEICQSLGVKSKATVYQHLVELELRGYILREPNKPRFISVIDGGGAENNNATNSGDSSFFAPDTALEKAKQSILRATYFGQAHQTLLLSHILGMAKARNISLYLVDHQKKLLVPKIWQGSWDQNQTPRNFKYGEGIAGRVWKTGNGYVSTSNLQSDPNYVQSTSSRSSKAKSLIVVPIKDFLGRFVGVVNLDSYQENEFSEELKQEIEDASKRASKFMNELELSEHASDLFSIEMFLWLFNIIISKESAIDLDPALFFRNEGNSLAGLPNRI